MVSGSEGGGQTRRWIQESEIPVECPLAHRLLAPLADRLTREPVFLRGAAVRDWTKKPTLWGSVDGRDAWWQGIFRTPPETVVFAWLETPDELSWVRLGSTPEDRTRAAVKVRDDETELILRLPTSVESITLPLRPAHPGSPEAVDGLVRADHETGVPWPVWRIPGTPEVRGGVLLFARPDVENLESGRWALRRELAAGLAEPLLAIVSDGRRGTVRSEELAGTV
jgi:hypothetical protein